MILNEQIYNLPTNDEATWDTICRGDTKGIFQLESKLCQHWSKESQPRSIPELSDLIAFVRPGVLEVKEEGKSIAQKYCDRKRGLEEVRYLHAELEPILKPTQGYLLFQEQTMRLSQLIAGFDLKTADILRKGIGTKDPKMLNDLEQKFLDGCREQKKIDEETAKVLFDNIKKSARYQFNASHSVSYSYIGYWTAFLKTHFPLDFYIEYLNNAKEKQKPKIEIKELITDARHHDIQTRMTTLEDLKRDNITEFYEYNDDILFGVEYVKGIGKAHIKSLLKKLENKSSWIDILESDINKTTFTNLISVGFFDNIHANLSRKEMLHEYNIYAKLSLKEVEYFKQLQGSIIDKLRFALENTIEPRKKILSGLIQSLENPSYSLKDDPRWLYDVEHELLGICLNFHKTDINNQTPNTVCKEILDGKNGECTLLLEITEPREYKIKRGNDKGKPMGSFNGSDKTGEIGCVCFAETWTENRHKLYDGAVIFVSGYKSKKGGLVISKIQ